MTGTATGVHDRLHIANIVGEHSIIDGDCDLRYQTYSATLTRVGEHSIIDGDCDVRRYYLMITIK